MTMRLARESTPLLLVTAVLLALMAPARPAAAVQSTDDGGLNSLSGTYLAARTADSGKDFASAARFYHTALQSDPENLSLLERALILSAAAGEVDEAIGFAAQLNAKAPDNHAARLVLAAKEMRERRFSEATKQLASAGDGVLADLTSALFVAWSRFGEGEVDKAIGDLRKLEGEEWYEPFKLLHIGYIALASGRTEEAISALETARELDSNAIRVTEAYARALTVAGRQPDAETVLEDFLTRFPDNPLARVALDDIRSGRAQDGTAATPSQGAAEALAGIGAAVGQEGGLEVAALYLRLSLYLDANTAGGLAALSLGNLLDASGQGEAAIAVFESIAPEAPFRALGVLRAALALDRMEKTEEAEAAFQEAVRRNPDDVQTYVSYGNMLRGRERFAEAAEIYSKAVEKVPRPGKGDWSLFYFRGIAFERTKEWDRAEADFRKALELSPDQPLVLNYLGYSLVDKGLKLDEAMEMIRKAVELRPADGYIVDSLGWAYYRLGRFEEAVTELERAVSLRADDPVIHDHLGDAYWKTGRQLEAQFQWRHARDFGAEGPELELILRKIAERRLIEADKDAALAPDQPGVAAPSFAQAPGADMQSAAP